MGVPYNGKIIESICYNQHLDEFLLYDVNGGLIERISHYQFLSHPQLKHLRSLKHGGHRRAGKKAHSNPVGAPNFSLAPGALNFAPLPTRAAQFTVHETKHAGIRAGEIIAPRCWRYYDGRLYSVYRNQIHWPPGKVVEGIDLSPGVHAFKDVFDSYVYAIESTTVIHHANSREEEVFIMGTVALWGEVFEHSRGWRAEYAKVKTIDNIFSLYHPYHTESHMRKLLLDQLRSLYNVGADPKNPTGDIDSVRFALEQYARFR